MFRSMRSCIAFLSAIGVVAACGATEPMASGATVRFQLDAPFCGSKFPVRFLVDGNVAAFDTLIIGYPSGDRTSHDVIVSPGTHTVWGELFSTYANDFQRVNGWDDNTLNVQPGQIAIDTLPFYCS